MITSDRRCTITMMSRKWILNQNAFDALLEGLDPKDRQVAAQKYEDIRRGLTRMFEHRGVLGPEDLADETINRVAHRLEEGLEISNFPAFFYGVARKVLKEHLEIEAKPMLLCPSEPTTTLGQKYEREEINRSFECLEKCLEEIPSESRDWILRYYSGEKSEKIAHRKEMATELGIPVNVLRIRAMRIRERLARCISECLQSKK